MPKFTQSLGVFADMKNLFLALFILIAIQGFSQEVWYAQASGGIAVNDGTKYIKASNSNLLSSLQITSILQDRNKTLWIGTADKGLVKYDIATNRVESDSSNFYKTLGTGKKQFITTLFESKDSTIWIGTLKSGLFSYDGYHFSHYDDTDGFLGPWVQCIEENSTGQLFIGTYLFGIYIYSDGVFENVSKKNDPVVSSLMTIQVDKNDVVWIGTDKGIRSLKDGEFTYYDEFSDIGFRSSMMDNNGNIWFGRAHHGIVIVRNGELTEFEHNETLGHSYILSMFHDSKDQYWIGTWNNGIFKFNGDQCVRIKNFLGDKANTIKGFVEVEAE